MEVKISGCVNAPGTYKLRALATLAEGLKAAGGLRKDRFLFPSGIITIRTAKHPVLRFAAKKRVVDIRRKPSALRTTRLRNREMVIVQFGGKGLIWWWNRQKR